MFAELERKATNGIKYGAARKRNWRPIGFAGDAGAAFLMAVNDRNN